MGLTFTEILSPMQSSILMYREGVADLQLCVDDVDSAYVSSAGALLISGTSLCTSPTREAALKALTLAKAAGCTVIFDADDRAYTWKNRDEASAAYWLGKEADILVIKHGKEGARAYSVSEGSWAVKPFPVSALKGFGGGDGYASSFLHALMAGRSLPEALERGSASAAMLVASHACSTDMPSEEALEAFISSQKPGCGEIVTKL